MELTTKVYIPFFKEIENSPFKFVETPLEVPLIIMVVPGSGFLPSVTFPES